MKAKNNKSSIWAVAAVLLLLPVFVFGAEQQKDEKTDNIPDNPKAVVANVRLDASLVGQSAANVFKIKLEFSNRRGIQAGVKYGIQLNRAGNGNSSIIFDQKVWDDALTLYENDTLVKEIEYTAPDFLKGVYSLDALAYDANGLILGYSPVDDVVLQGSGQYLEIMPSTCTLSIKGKENEGKFILKQGVDILPEETLIATCDVASHAEMPLDTNVKFETRYRSSFGDVVGTSGETPSSSFRFEPGETKTISFPLPKAVEPQAYDVSAVLSVGSKTISTPIRFHYVLHGLSATIQNVRLDKDQYQKGDNASIGFVWTPSADSFLGSRLGKSSLDGGKISFAVDDSQGNRCGSLDKSLSDISSDGLMQEVSVPIQADCIDPHLTVKVTDQKGKDLDSKEIIAKSKGVSTRTSAAEKLASMKKIAFEIVIILFIVSIGMIVARAIQKRSAGRISMFLFGVGLVTIGVLLSGSGVAHADTLTTHLVASSPAVDDSATATVNLRWVDNNTMRLVWSISSSEVCGNCTTNHKLRFTVRENGGRTILDETDTCSASGDNGSHPMTISGNYPTQVCLKLIATADETVSATECTTLTLPDPSASISISPNWIDPGDAVTLTWNSNHATDCTASGAWSGNRATSNSLTRYPAVTSTFCIECSNANSGQSSGVRCDTVNVRSCAGSCGNPADHCPGTTWSNGCPGGANACNGGTKNCLGSHAQDGPVCVNKTLQFCSADCSVAGAWCNATSWTSSCGGTWSNNTGYQTPVSCCIDSDCGAGCTCNPFSNTCSCGGGAVCGNGIVESGEACDNGGANGACPATCSSSCTVNSCGQICTPGWDSANCRLCNASGTAWLSNNCQDWGNWTYPGFTADLWCACNYRCQPWNIDPGCRVPIVSISANPGTVVQGNGSTLIWSATNNPSWCWASWIGMVPPPNGSSWVVPGVTTNYAVTCGNAGGQNTASTTVTVNPAQPVVSLSANPALICTGNNSTLTWSATNNPTSCTSNIPGFNMGTPSYSVSPAATTTYQVTCSNITGSSTGSAVVTVDTNHYSNYLCNNVPPNCSGRCRQTVNSTPLCTADVTCAGVTLNNVSQPSGDCTANGHPCTAYSSYCTDDCDANWEEVKP